MKNIVSIIIPVFNGEKHINKCILSCLNQTHSFFELIIVSDGSTDNTNNIIRNINDDRVRLFVTKNNGVSAARNIGIENSTGEFILFLDSDDYLEPNYISELLNNVMDSDLVICGYNIIAEDNILNVNLNVDDKISLLDNFYLDKIVSSPWCKLYKSKIIKENNIKFKSLSFMEDGIFNMEYIKYCNGNFSVLNKNLYFYRKSDSGLTHDITNKKYIDILKSINIQEKIYQEIESENINNKVIGYRRFFFTIMFPSKNKYKINNIKFNVKYIKNNLIPLHYKVLYLILCINFKGYLKADKFLCLLKETLKK